MHRRQSKLESAMASASASIVNESSSPSWIISSDGLNFVTAEADDEESATSSCSSPWNYGSTGWVVLGYLQVAYVPLISLAGVVGNVLSILVFLRTNLRTRSSSYYLAALAAADTTFLAQLLVVSLSYLDVDLYNRNGGCQALVYLSSVSTFLSVWLVVAFTVERFIAIQYPLQRPKMCTVQRAKRIVCGLVLFALLVNAYLPFSAVAVHEDDDDGDGRTVCDVFPAFRHAFYVINVVDTVATLALPVTLIVLMNSMIAVKLFRFSRSHRRAEHEAEAEASAAAAAAAQAAAVACTHGPHRSSGHPMSLIAHDEAGPQISSSSGNSITTVHSQSHNNNHVFHQQKSIKVIMRHYPYGGCGGGGGGAVSGDRKLMSRTTLSHKAQNNVTKMLLIISTTFLCLNIPSYVMRIHNYYHRNCLSETSDLVQQYTMILFYTNFSTNFLLYSTCGISFRRALCDFRRRYFR